MLRRFWSKFLTLDWKLGILLILFFGIIRFAIVLNATVTGDFKYVSLLFVLMILLPFLLLNKTGLKKIGVSKPLSFKWLGGSFVFGIIICTLLYLIGILLYQKTSSNWFFSIGGTYPIDFGSIAGSDKKIYFVIFSIIGMTFSPFGEELMYRGLIHQSLVDKFGEKSASLIDSGAFGITHLAHFGLLYEFGQWHFLAIPALLWVLLIFVSGLVFNFCKNKTGSLTGAIACHAGFNLAMTYFIFYKLF